MLGQKSQPPNLTTNNSREISRKYLRPRFTMCGRFAIQDGMTNKVIVFPGAGLTGQSKNDEIEVDDIAWQCGCGSQFYYLTPGHPECAKCGKIPRDWMNGDNG